MDKYISGFMDRYMIGLWPSSKKKKNANRERDRDRPFFTVSFFFRPSPLSKGRGAILKVSCRASALPLDQFGNKPKSAT
jgi:hypothetical protein